MPDNSIESLSIEITANTQSAVNSIQSLSNKLTELSNSLGSLSIGNLKSFSDGILNFGTSLKVFSNEVKTTDFTRLSRNLSSLGEVDTGNLGRTAETLASLGEQIDKFSSLGEVSANISEMAKSLGQFGSEKMIKVANTLPQLAESFTAFLESLSKAPKVSQNLIDFTNALGNLTSNGQKVASSANGLTNAVKSQGKVFNNTRKHARSLASTIGLMYAKYALAFRGIKKLYSEIKGTADYLEAYNFLNVATGKVGAEYYKDYGYETADAYADAFREELNKKFKQMSGITLDLDEGLIKTTDMKSLGLNLKEITQYSAELTSLTNSLGMTGEASLAASKALTMLSADLGSLKNVDFGTVSKNLESGLMGMARSVYKYGLDITQASLANIALANGIDKSVTEMSQQEKAQLRLLAILEQSKVAWGDLANTINSPTNLLRQLKTNLSELGTVIGQLFIPVLQKVLPWINGLTIALKNLVVNIAEILGIKLNLDDFGQGYSDSLEEIAEAYDDVDEAAKKAKAGIRAFDVLTVISSGASKKADDIADNIDLTQQILKAVDDYEKVWDEAYNKMTSKAQEIASVIGNALQPIKTIIEDFAIGDFFKAGQDTSQLVADIFNFVAKAIKSVDWNKLGKKVGEFIKGIKWGEILKGLGNILGSAIQGAIDIWTGMFDVAPFETALLTAFAVLKITGLDTVIFGLLKGGITKGIDKLAGAEGMAALKANIAKIGIGSILIGVGVSLELSDIKAVNSGEYKWDSIDSIIKSVAASALVAGGTALTLSALGVSAATAGVVGFIVLAVGVAISMVIKGCIAPSDADLDYEMQKALYSWTTDSVNRSKEVGVKLKARIDDVDTSNLNLEMVAEKVWDMSAAFDSLSEGEKMLLKEYSNQLIEIMPDLADKIDSVTGAYKGTREELDKLIKSTEDYAYAQAYSENIADTIAEIAKAEKDFSPVEAEYNMVHSQYLKAWNGIYQQMLDMGADESWASEARQKIWKAFINGEKEVLFGNKKFGDEYKESVFNVDDWIGDFGSFAEMTNKDKALANAYDNMYANLARLNGELSYWEDKYSDKVTTMSDNTDKALTDTAKVSSDGLDKIESIFRKSKLGTYTKTSVVKAVNSIKDTIAKGEQPTKDQMQKLYSAINNGLAELNNGNIPKNISDVLSKMWDLIDTGSTDGYNEMLSLGTQLVAGFDTAGVSGSVGNTVQDAIDTIGSTYTNNKSTIENYGKNTITAYGNGAKSEMENLKGAFTEGVNNAMASAFSNVNSGSAIDLKIKGWVSSIKQRIESAMSSGEIDLSSIQFAGAPYANTNTLVSGGKVVSPVGSAFDFRDLQLKVNPIDVNISITTDTDTLYSAIVEKNQEEIKRTGLNPLAAAN